MAPGRGKWADDPGHIAWGTRRGVWAGAPRSLFPRIARGLEMCVVELLTHNRCWLC